VEFVDIAGLVKGAAEGEGLGNKFLAHIRNVDAIVEVVRVFKNGKIIHIHNKIDPSNDVGVIETELILADLETVSKRIADLEREIKSQDKDAVKNLEIVKKIKNFMEKGISARDCGLDEEERGRVSDLHLLTFKPVIYLYNVSGDEIDISDDLMKKRHVVLDIKMEEDIFDMSDREKKELGVESKISELIEEAYKLLGLMTFFTTGEDESRAWTIKNESTAPEAGAAIHTDFQEKFIKADVINWQILLDSGSYVKAREKGLIRTEGKEYIVKDGDVIEFKI
jgi:ribosome-binding ATPase